MTVLFTTICPICAEKKEFLAADDYWSGRDGLGSPACPLGNCVTRERAMAAALFDIFSREAVASLSVHEAAPGGRGISTWLWKNVKSCVLSGYFPEKPFGQMVGHIRNEDLEHQTFADECFDLVVHLDVMEHLFDPFQALVEIYRTLKPGGFCLFTTPTYPERTTSEQVAFVNNGKVSTVGAPEYHGNPQGDGSLVTWRYGYDLPLLISRHTDFDVEVRRWQSRSEAVFGIMNEVYILRKTRLPGATSSRGPASPI